MIFTAQQHGFEGAFYPADSRDTAVVVLTGTDGGLKWAGSIATQLAARGIPSLAVAYWGTEQTPDTLSLIPIETVEAAVGWLKTQGYARISLYGFSKGAELALVSSALLSGIGGVVAVSPACCVFEGVAKPAYSGTSSWTWRGQALPYASFARVPVNMLRNILANGEFGFRKEYEAVLASEMTEANSIGVERIAGPVLLLSAENDAQWPAAQMGDILCCRLREEHFAHPYRHVVFPKASHILCPIKTPLRFAYYNERKYPKSCDEARAKAFELSVAWLLGQGMGVE